MVSNFVYEVRMDKGEQGVRDAELLQGFTAHYRGYSLYDGAWMKRRHI